MSPDALRNATKDHDVDMVIFAGHGINVVPGSFAFVDGADPMDCATTVRFKERNDDAGVYYLASIAAIQAVRLKAQAG